MTCVALDIGCSFGRTLWKLRLNFTQHGQSQSNPNHLPAYPIQRRYEVTVLKSLGSGEVPVPKGAQARHRTSLAAPRFRQIPKPTAAPTYIRVVT